MCVGVHDGSVSTIAVLVGADPFINQIAVSPVVLFDHTRSDLPSPFRSPVSATFHDASPVRNAVAVIAVPFMSVSAVTPDVA